jgi:class 3 adenylate cyclase
VILAAHTREKAAGGEILVTEVVRHLVTRKGFLFAERGAIEMKGFEERCACTRSGGGRR